MNLFKVASMFLTKDEFRSHLKYKIEFFHLQIKSQAQTFRFKGRQREIHSPTTQKRKKKKKKEEDLVEGVSNVFSMLR